MSAHTPWKAVRAFQNNGPDYWLIYEGRKTFGADPVAQVNDQETAERIVAEHNSHTAMLEALRDCVGRLEAYYGPNYPAVVNGKRAIAQAEGKVSE